MIKEKKMINEYEELKYLSYYKTGEACYLMDYIGSFQRIILNNGIIKALKLLNDFISQNQIDDEAADFIKAYTKEIEKKNGIYKTPDNVKQYIKSEANK